MKLYEKDGHYLKAQELSSGKTAVYRQSLDIDIAIMKQEIYQQYNSFKDFLDNGWREVTDRNRTRWLEGDIIVDENGWYKKILGRHGVGEDTLYHMSCSNQDINSISFNFSSMDNYTAYELKDHTLVQTKKMTKAEAEKLLSEDGETVEIIK